MANLHRGQATARVTAARSHPAESSSCEHEETGFTWPGMNGLKLIRGLKGDLRAVSDVLVEVLHKLTLDSCKVKAGAQGCSSASRRASTCAFALTPSSLQAGLTEAARTLALVL